MSSANHARFRIKKIWWLFWETKRLSYTSLKECDVMRCPFHLSALNLIHVLESETQKVGEEFEILSKTLLGEFRRNIDCWRGRKMCSWSSGKVALLQQMGWLKFFLMMILCLWQKFSMSFRKEGKQHKDSWCFPIRLGKGHQKLESLVVIGWKHKIFVNLLWKDLSWKLADGSQVSNTHCIGSAVGSEVLWKERVSKLRETNVFY